MLLDERPAHAAVTESGAVYYVGTDHIGLPIFATDDTGVKGWEASYLPFGGVHLSTGAPLDLRFPGQWFQLETACTRTGCATTIRQRGGISRSIGSGSWVGHLFTGMHGRTRERYVDPMGLYTLTCKPSGGHGGYGEIGYEYGDFYEGNRKTCRYECTRNDMNEAQTFEPCSIDMSNGDQCRGVTFYSQSTMDPPYSTTMKSGDPVKFQHDTNLSFWDRWTNSDLVDFNRDVLNTFGNE